MKNYSIVVLLFLQINFLGAQTQSDANLLFQNTHYCTYVIDIDSSTLSNISLFKNTGHLIHKDFIEEYIANHDSNFFAINACVNDMSGEPLGLLISDSMEINPLNLDNGNGNFFLKPNGVLVITRSDVEIVESSSFRKENSIIKAIQSGPMLILDDSINTSFNAKSTNKNLRCGVGISMHRKKKYLVFSISNEPVTFYEFASLFKVYFNCKNALCLESGNSVMYTPKNTNGLAINKVVGNYIIYDPQDSNSTVNIVKSKNVIQMTKGASGIYELPIELNNVLKISFIFDPGATDVCISPDVAYTLMRTGTITDKDYIGTQKYVFADGSTAISNVFMLHELKIGTLKIKNVRVSISKSLTAPMLLGQSLLQRLGKFTVDNTNHTLNIE